MNEYIESEKDSSNKTFRLTLTILIGIIVLSPILIAIFVTNDWAFTKMLSKVDGNSSIWIGFWGSYLGGALGTIGVIFVAQLQNKEQRRLNNEVMKEQLRNIEKVERNNNERLKIETKINILKEYNKNLHKIISERNKFESITLELIHHRKIINKFKDHATIIENHIESFEILQKEIKVLTDDYFTTLFDEVTFVNYVLRIEKSHLQKPMDTQYQEDVDDLLFLLKSDDIIRTMQIKFEEDINEENYIDKMEQLHKSFYNIYEWTLNEIANSNKDLGEILSYLNSNKQA